MHKEVVSSWFVSLHCYKRRSGMKQRRLTLRKYFCLHGEPNMNHKLLQVIDDHVSNSQL